MSVREGERESERANVRECERERERVCERCIEPGQVSSNGDCCKVKRSKAPSDLLEGRAVASITSEEESMVRTQNRPAAP